jgi:protease-4
MTEGRSRVWLWVVIGGAAFFLFFLAVFSLVYMTLKSGAEGGDYGMSGGGGNIGVIDVTGVIIDPREVVTNLKRFADDDSIKAIILHINTPGGGAAASEEIYRAVRRIREEKKKRVVASIETVGASGGYYVCSATDKIWADDASVVGSIGVIAEWYNYGDLLRWAKLKDTVIKSGEFKDTGNPSRDLTPAERDYLQGMIDNMLGQFVHAVAQGRKMKDEDVRSIANGKVWTGQQALGLKLVDQIGDFQTAVMDTAKSVGIKGEPTLIRPSKPKRSLLDILFGDASDLMPDTSKVLGHGPGFFYLWQMAK